MRDAEYVPFGVELKTMGVIAVTVVGEAAEGQTLSPEERLAALNARFAPHAQNRLMMELRDLLARQLREGADAAKPR